VVHAHQLAIAELAAAPGDGGLAFRVAAASLSLNELVHGGSDNEGHDADHAERGQNDLLIRAKPM
jgi:hypothetical protein